MRGGEVGVEGANDLEDVVGVGQGVAGLTVAREAVLEILKALAQAGGDVSEGGGVQLEQGANLLLLQVLRRTVDGVLDGVDGGGGDAYLASLLVVMW